MIKIDYENIRTFLINNKYHLLIFVILTILFYFLFVVIDTYLYYKDYTFQSKKFENYLENYKIMEKEPFQAFFIKNIFLTKNNVTFLLTYNGTIIALKENEKVYSIANISTLSAKNKQINLIQIQIDDINYFCMGDGYNPGNFSCNVRKMNEIIYNKSFEKFFKELYEKRAIAFEIPSENSSDELIIYHNNISFSCSMIKGELLINRLNEEEKLYYLFQAGMNQEEINLEKIIKKIEYANFTICLKDNYKLYQSLSAYVRDENNRIMLYNSEIFYMNISNKTNFSKEQILALLNKVYLTTT